MSMGMINILQSHVICTNCVRLEQRDRLEKGPKAGLKETKGLTIKDGGMLHLWLIPLLLVAGLAVFCLYILVKYRGGKGERSSGRTIVDRSEPQADPPPREAER